MRDQLFVRACSGTRVPLPALSVLIPCRPSGPFCSLPVDASACIRATLCGCSPHGFSFVLGQRHACSVIDRPMGGFSTTGSGCAYLFLFAFLLRRLISAAFLCFFSQSAVWAKVSRYPNSEVSCRTAFCASFLGIPVFFFCFVPVCRNDRYRANNSNASTIYR